MKDKEVFSDRNLILFIFLIGIAFFYFYKKHKLHTTETKSKAPFLAEVTGIKNDVRKKMSSSLDFKKTKIEELIHRGDSISTGEASSASVRFKNGQLLTIDQKSLIIFDEQTDTPEFVSGNIKLTIDGKMNFKINNEIVQITGNKSNIQIFNDKKSNKQKLVLLAGQAELKSEKNVIQLKTNTITEIKEILLSPEDFLKAKKKESLTNISSYIKPLPPVTRLPATNIIEKQSYKLYDVYTAKFNSNQELTLNTKFTEKQNFTFQNFSIAQIAAEAQSLKQDNQFIFRITDSVKPLGYVFEISLDRLFKPEATQYFWGQNQFKHQFKKSGLYFIRFRKVLNNQFLTYYSQTDSIEVLDKQKKTLSQEKLQKFPLIEPNPEKQKIKDVVVQKPPTVERLPAALPENIKNIESDYKIEPTSIITNQNYTSSYASLLGSQAYLASGKQIGNNREFVQSYNLGFDILHWQRNQGFRLTFDKALISKTSNNSILRAEASYLYRFFQNWNIVNGKQFQYSISGGLETFQNLNATSDYIKSYNLYKLGIGASFPIFNRWVASTDVSLGFGSEKSSSLTIKTEGQYTFDKVWSLGVGLRASKYDYYLLDQKNSESISETFTTFRYNY